MHESIRFGEWFMIVNGTIVAVLLLMMLIRGLGARADDDASPRKKNAAQDTDRTENPE